MISPGMYELRSDATIKLVVLNYCSSERCVENRRRTYTSVMPSRMHETEDAPEGFRRQNEGVLRAFRLRPLSSGSFSVSVPPSLSIVSEEV